MPGSDPENREEDFVCAEDAGVASSSSRAFGSSQAGRRVWSASRVFCQTVSGDFQKIAVLFALHLCALCYCHSRRPPVPDRNGLVFRDRVGCLFPGIGFSVVRHS